MRAIFLCADPKKIESVFGEKTTAAIGELLALSPVVYKKEDVLTIPQLEPVNAFTHAQMRSLKERLKTTTPSALANKV